jgi:hypothetical protein
LRFNVVVAAAVGRLWSAVDSNGRTIFVADAHRDNRKRFVVRAEKMTAFVALESVIRANRG